MTSARFPSWLWPLTTVVLAAIILFGSISFVRSEAKPQSLFGDTPLTLLTCRIPFMACPGCAWAVGDAIEVLPGVFSADVDFGTMLATIIYDPLQTTREEISSHGIFEVYGYEFVSEKPYTLSPL